MATKKAAPKSREAVAETQAVEVQKVVAAMTPEGVTKNLSNAALSVQKSIAGISSEVVGLFGQRDKLVEDIAAKEKALADLHEIEVSSTTLAELTHEIDTTRTHWVAEQAEHEKEKERAEEEEEYAATRKAKEKDDENKDRQAQLEKGWKERSLALAAQETHLQDLEDKVAAFPKELEDATNAAEGKGRGMAESKAKADAAIIAAQHNAQISITTAANANLAQQITKLEAQVTALTAQLTQAHADNKEIAGKAVEGAAARELASNMQRALEGQQQGSPRK